MSDAISLYIDGYTSTGYAGAIDTVKAGGAFPASSMRFECDLGPCIGASGYPSPAPDPRTVEVASLAAEFPDADYFTVGVHIDTPSPGSADGGFQCRRPALVLLNCAVQLSDGRFSVDFRWVHDLSVGTESVYSPMAGAADLRTFEGSFAKSELGLGPAYLLNDTPSYPVPDSGGNEVGRILFTAAELPATVSVYGELRFMEFYSGGENQDYEISVGLRPYYSNTVETISSEGLMCVL